ncbi:MAG: hypothetical protein AAF742_00065 [Pseudomonadota bacterium]
MRALEDALMKVHDEWKERTGQEGLSSAELKRLAKQGNKDKWNYTCKEQPLRGFCNAKLCKKRDFGIGSRKDDLDTPIDSFTIVESMPPVYFFEYEGNRVSMEAEELVNQNNFSLALVKQCNRTFPRVQQAVFDEMINDLLKGATKVAAPSGGDLRIEVGEYLLSYLGRLAIPRGTGHDEKFRVQGRPLRDGDWVMFKAPVFRDWLKTKDVKLKSHVLLEMLRVDFGCEEFNTSNEDQKTIRGWKGNLNHISDVVNA